MIMLCAGMRMLRRLSKFPCSRNNVLFNPYQITQLASLHEGSSLHSETESTENLMDVSDPDADSHNEEINLKIQILHASLKFVPDHGWSKKSICLGAQSVGLSSASHSLFDGGGADLVHYFNFLCNENLCNYLKEKSLETTKEKNIQEYIEIALEKRLNMVIPYVSQWPEALARIALPTQAPTDLKNLLELADIICSYSSSKDLNVTWYSRRLSLAVSYKLAELNLIQDKSPEYANTIEFLKRLVEMTLTSNSFLEQVVTHEQELPTYGHAALTTVQNLLGCNRWFR